MNSGWLATGLINLCDAPLEINAGFHRTQDFIAGTKHAFKQLEFLIQQFVHPFVGLVLTVEKVDHHHVMLLSVTVATANALFNALWVPRQVVVDDHRAELEVDTLSACFRGNHDRAVSAVEFAEVLHQCGACICAA